MKGFVRVLKLPCHYGKLLLVILQCKLLLFLALLRNGFQSRRILCLPFRPHPHSTLYKIIHRLGFAIAAEGDQADLVMFWEDSAIRQRCEAIEEIARSRKVINQNCRDIRKSQVADVFERVFGYALTVRAQEYNGPMVKKSDERNGLHDGTIVFGPIADPEIGFVYQKVVNNIDGNRVCDLRVPIFGKHISFVMEQWWPAEQRFANCQGSGVIRPAESLLMPDEIEAIKKFCFQIGLDYGELDVLRDRDDAKLYIVDANNTPYGPLGGGANVKWYFDAVSWDGLERMATLFREAFIDDPGYRWFRDQPREQKERYANTLKS